MNKFKVKIIDTTLRDGEQTPGVVFTIEEKIKILKLLSLTGIYEAEAGIPAMGDHSVQDLQRILSLGLPMKISGWLRADELDIIKAYEAGLERVHVSLPFSPLLRSLKKLSLKDCIDLSDKFINRAKEKFSFVSVGIQDAFRSEIYEIVLFCKKAFQAGADRLRIADTIGKSSPLKIYSLFNALKGEDIPLEKIEYHGHNDLGMATANSIMALESGAGFVSATVNGIGERAGNAALEELVMAVKYNDSLKGSFNSRYLTALARTVERASNIKLSPLKPVVGSEIFNYESGIHTWGMNRNKKSYELISPEEVGSIKRKVIIGKHAGINTVIMFFKERGFDISREEAESVLEFFKEKRFCKGGIPEEDVLDFYDIIKSKKILRKL